MTVLATDTFAGRTVGSGWGTASDGNTWSLKNGSFLVTSVGSNEGKCHNGGPGQMLLGSGTPTDCEGLVRFSVGDLSDFVGLILRDTGDGSNSNYTCAIGEFANDLTIYKIASGSRSYVDVQATGLTIAINTFYWIRFQAISNNLKARIWADGSSEPNTWLCSGPDSTYASGQYGIYLNTQTAADAKFDSYQANDTSTTPTRTITASAALQSLGLTRTITSHAALQSTLTRTITSAAALQSLGLTRTITSSAAVQVSRQISAAASFVISRNIACSASFSGGNANLLQFSHHKHFGYQQ